MGVGTHSKAPPPRGAVLCWAQGACGRVVAQQVGRGPSAPDVGDLGVSAVYLAPVWTGRACVFLL